MVQYYATTPKDYLDQLEQDWRKETLLGLRNLILAQSDSIQEGMQYKMLRYSDGSDIIFHLNAQKHYVSLYVGDIKKINLSLDFLDGLNLGKGCIRFTKTRKLKDTKIKAFIQQAIKFKQENKNLDC